MNSGGVLGCQEGLAPPGPGTPWREKPGRGSTAPNPTLSPLFQGTAMSQESCTGVYQRHGVSTSQYFSEKRKREHRNPVGDEWGPKNANCIIAQSRIIPPFICIFPQIDALFDWVSISLILAIFNFSVFACFFPLNHRVRRRAIIWAGHFFNSMPLMPEQKIKLRKLSLVTMPQNEWFFWIFECFFFTPFYCVKLGIFGDNFVHNEKSCFFDLFFLDPPTGFFFC